MRDEDNNIVNTDDNVDKAQQLVQIEENKLLDEIKELQTKYEDISLIYDKVRVNIKNLIEDARLVVVAAQERSKTDKSINKSTDVNETNMETRNDTNIQQDTEAIVDENDIKQDQEEDNKQSEEDTKNKIESEEKTKDEAKPQEENKLEEKPNVEQKQKEEISEKSEELSEDGKFLKDYFNTLKHIKNRLSEVFLSVNQHLNF